MIRELSARGATEVEPKVQVKPADEKNLKAARDFEAIFVRKILSCLEKTSHGAGDGGGMNAGGGMYGSMMVGALSDAIADSGGFGLAQELMRDMKPPQKTSDLEPLKGAATISSQASVALTAHDGKQEKDNR